MSASILQFSEDNIISIDTYVIGKIVDQRGNRPPSILYSLNGQQRTGTSFMLDKFLLFLTTKRAPNPTWTNTSHAKFINNRSGGKEGDAFSMQMWSKPFIAKIHGREVAILLMETKESLDDQTHQDQSEMIFAISSLFSSVLIFHVKRDIKKNTLQLLQLFTGFTKMINKQKATTQGEKILFQKLIFLIRDMEFNQYGFGYYDDNLCTSAAALAVKNRYLQPKGYHSVKVCLVREEFEGNFMEIGLICLPHAEKALTMDHTNSRKHNPEFQCHLKTFVQLMFTNENIKSRQISTKETSDNFKQEVNECWTKLFHGNEISEFKSVYEAVAEMQNTITMQKALGFYDKKINKFIRANPTGVNEKTWVQNSAYLSNESLDVFYKTRRMGGSENGKRYADNLSKLILTRQNIYFQLNQNASKEDEKGDAVTDKLQLEAERKRVEPEAAEGEKRHQESEASQVEIRRHKETEVSEAKIRLQKEVEVFEDEVSEGEIRHQKDAEASEEKISETKIRRQKEVEVFEDEVSEAEIRHQKDAEASEEVSEAKIRHQKEAEASEAKKVHHEEIERILREEAATLQRQTEEANRQTQLQLEELQRVQEEKAAQQRSRLEKCSQKSQRKRFYFF